MYDIVNIEINNNIILNKSFSLLLEKFAENDFIINTTKNVNTNQVNILLLIKEIQKLS